MGPFVVPLLGLIQPITQVYASIVGNCAWSPRGCPIIQQNLIDLVYSELAASGSNVWPDSAQTLIDTRISKIFKWTAFTTKQGIPYRNFNDFLHYFKENQV